MTKRYSFSSRLTAFLLVWAFAAPVFAFGTAENTDRKALTEDQRILHVLNRLGFGPRPGDLEKVRAIGLQKYIEQQLNPTEINDTTAEAKVRNLEVFNMSTAQVFAKYPNPGALLRQLEGGRQAQADAQARRNASMMPFAHPAQTPACWRTSWSASRRS